MNSHPPPNGATSLVLVGGVALLHPEDAVADAMYEGWRRQMLGGRLSKEKSIANRVSVIRRFGKWSNAYPWQWTAADVDEWMTELVATHGRAASTIRFYQGSLRMFCDYITSPHYGWDRECSSRFGVKPVQVCHEWNTCAHLVDYEGRAERRPLTRDEIQRLLDYADDRVDHIVRQHRKGALAAYRDATVLKMLYGWGLRCNEVCRLDTADFYGNSHAPSLGRFATVHVRYGKASRGSPPKRRTVHSVMPWAVDAVRDYLANIRPRYPDHSHPAMFLTERGSRLKPRDVQHRFAEYREALGLEALLTPHCLRHSYVTHLIEDGADPVFVQNQVGHRFASTTAIYTAVSTDFMNTMMRKVLHKNMNDAPR